MKLTNKHIVPIAKVIATTLLMAGIVESPARATSLSCKKPPTLADKIVCGDPSLLSLDHELAGMVTDLAKHMKNPLRSTFLAEDKKWHQWRNIMCKPPVSATDMPNCLQEDYSRRIAAIESGCPIDQSHTLDEMIASEDRTHWFNAIPKGLEIDPRITYYEVTNGPIQTYALPSLQSIPLGGIGGLLRTYRATAQCRVKTPDGKWWLVDTGFTGRSVFYIPQDKAR